MQPCPHELLQNWFSLFRIMRHARTINILQTTIVTMEIADLHILIFKHRKAVEAWWTATQRTKTIAHDWLRVVVEVALEANQEMLRLREVQRFLECQFVSNAQFHQLASAPQETPPLSQSVR